MKTKIKYLLDAKEVIYFHNLILEKFWWLKWVKDEQQIESMLTHIQNDEYYPTLITLALWKLKTQM